MSMARMTEQVLKAIRNPYVDAIGHPTGRILGGRPPYELDVEALLEAAAETATALEINASPKRLDLKDSYVRRAVERKMRIVIDTDAHSVAELEQIGFGVAVARRGWAEAGTVRNTLPLPTLLERIRRPP